MTFYDHDAHVYLRQVVTIWNAIMIEDDFPKTHLVKQTIGKEVSGTIKAKERELSPTSLRHPL